MLVRIFKLSTPILYVCEQRRLFAYVDTSRGDRPKCWSEFSSYLHQYFMYASSGGSSHMLTHPGGIGLNVVPNLKLSTPILYVCELRMLFALVDTSNGDRPKCWSESSSYLHQYFMYASSGGSSHMLIHPAGIGLNVGPNLQVIYTNTLCMQAAEALRTC